MVYKKVICKTENICFITLLESASSQIKFSSLDSLVYMLSFQHWTDSGFHKNARSVNFYPSNPSI